MRVLAEAGANPFASPNIPNDARSWPSGQARGPGHHLLPVGPAQRHRGPLRAGAGARHQRATSGAKIALHAATYHSRHMIRFLVESGADLDAT